MAKINISKEIILSIAKQDNSKFIDKVDETVNNILYASIEKLSESVSYVTPENVYIQPENELLNGAMLDNSQFVYLLGIDNAQLELNTVNQSQLWKNIKERFKFVWENRRYFNRKNRKKKKRRKKKEEPSQEELVLNNIKIDNSKYNIYNVTRDLQDVIIQYLSETSICYAKDNVLTIIGKDDFGANTQIIIKILNYTEPFFKEFKSKRKGFKEINIDMRCKLLEEKYDIVGENYIKVLKILNLIYFNTNKSYANQVFFESILNYCPDYLFEGKDVYDVFVKIINFLYYKPLTEIKSINNPSKNIIEDEVCGKGSSVAYKKMLDAIASRNDM